MDNAFISICYNQEDDVVEMDGVKSDNDFQDFFQEVHADVMGLNRTVKRIVIILIEVEIMKFRLDSQLEALLSKLKGDGVIGDAVKLFVEDSALQYDALPEIGTEFGPVHVLFKAKMSPFPDRGESFWQFSVVEFEH